jgi:hypothetical protein
MIFGLLWHTIPHCIKCGKNADFTDNTTGEPLCVIHFADAITDKAIHDFQEAFHKILAGKGEE